MKRRILGFALHLLMCLAPAWAWAASYTFPGALPPGCSGAGPSYTCGALTLAWGDTIAVNSPRPATITINGNLNVSNAQINWGGNASDLTLIVNGALSGNSEPRIKANIQVTGNASIVYRTQLTGNLTVGGTLTFSSESITTGNVSAAGAVTLGNRTTISGMLTGASVSDSSGSCVLTGAVTANTGAISLGNQTQVTGNVTATAGSITLAGSAKVTGNANAGTTLTMQGGSQITGNATAKGAATTAWASKIGGTTNVGSLSDAGASTFGGAITASAGPVVLGTTSTVAGDVTATAGTVSLGHQTRVSGNVIDNATTGGVITLGSSSQVNCALTKSTATGSINISGWDARPAGVCCLSGSSCLPVSNACYKNDSGRAISTTACAGLTAPSAVKVGSCAVAGVTDSYATVQAAVDAVADGGTVWICPGTYPERVNVNKAGLTVTSTTGNPDDVIIRYTRSGESAGQEALTINGNNVTISALTIIADGSSRWHGVNLVGANPRLTSVKVSSNSDGPNAGTSAIILKGATNVTIDGASSVTTALGFGITNIYGSASAVVNPTFSGLTVNAGARGIYLRDSVAGAVNLSNVNVTTSKWDAVRLESAGGVTHRIDKVVVMANATGGDATAFALSNATSTGTVANITDSTFKSKATNINGYGGLSLSRISGGTMSGTEVESPVGPTFLYSNVTGMTFSGNVFRTTQTTNNYGTVWNNSENGDNRNTFTGNCIHGVQRLARVQGDRLDDGSRGNYWADNGNCGTPNASGICPNRYTSYGGERDNFPLSTCSAFAPLGDWRLDEGPWKDHVAGTLIDSSGNGLTGMAYSDVASGSGKLCSAASFASGAVAQSGLLASDNPKLDVQSVTLTAWVYPTGYGGWDSIVNRWAAYNMLMESNGLFRARMAVDGTDTAPVWRDTSSVGLYKLPLNTWSMVAASYDGRYTKTYVYDASGAYLGGQTHDFGSTLPIRNSIHSVRIGSWATSAPQEQFDGKIDEVKVFGRALGAAEIAAIAVSEAAGKNWDGSARTCPGTAACAYPVHAGGSLSVGENSEINNHDITGSGNAINPDTGARTTATQTLGSLNPATFPSYSGGGNYSGSAGGLAAGTYNNVTLTGGTLASGTYYIGSLTVSGNVTFAGGTVYVRTLSFAKELDIWFSAATDFRVATSVSIGKSTDLRPASGATETVPARFYLYNDADFTAGTDGEYEGRFAGIVVAPGAGSNITFGKTGDERCITGALVTAGRITLGKESCLTFNSAAQAALGSSGVCGGGTPPSTPPANFNCVEVGANASSGHLYTKLVGTAFNFDVVALKSDGAIETSYAADGNKNVSVELVDGSGNIACASRTAISPAVSQTLTFAASDQGRKAAAGMTVNKAYANLKCRASEGSVKGCSGDSFAVRPTGLTVTSTNANADGNGTSTSNTPAIKTGVAFSLTATAVPGYNGTPVLDAGKVQAHAGAVRAGSLTGSFAAADAASGAATGGAFGYDEAGYFRLASNGVIDTGFTSVDAGGDCTDDFSNTAVGGKVGCKFGNPAATAHFGRFIPDHFALTPGALTQGCGGFTYYGQPFSTAFTLTAQNVSNATTQNYASGFARLPLSRDGLVFSAVDADAAAVTLSNDGMIVGSWGSGVASVTTASHTVTRALSGAPDAPKSVTVKAKPADADGVTLVTATAVHGSAAPHRFGRLRMDNANGSELLALPVPTRVQYWNGSGFVTNAEDNCTSLPAPTLTAGNPLAVTDSTATYANSPLLGGEAGLSLSKPAGGKAGYLDLSIDLSALPWLQYNWDGIDQPVGSPDLNLFDDNPRARASFGKRGGSNKIIIRQESHAR